MKWSFSRVNSYHTCPRMFLGEYIKRYEQEENSFGEWGSFGHEILEKYYNKDLSIYELAGIYEDEYDEKVITPFPPNRYVNLGEKYYDTGLDYFMNFGDPFKDYEVLGVEQKLDLKVGKYEFTGYIDLILKNENGITIVDHKSKSKFKNKTERMEYLRQLYLYSLFIYKKYKEYPYELIFNMFRTNEIVRELFDKDGYDESKKWLKDTIQQIYNDEEFITRHKRDLSPEKYEKFMTKRQDFFCNWICGVREYCECSDKYIG